MYKINIHSGPLYSIPKYNTITAGSKFIFKTNIDNDSEDLRTTWLSHMYKAYLVQKCEEDKTIEYEYK